MNCDCVLSCLSILVFSGFSAFLLSQRSHFLSILTEDDVIGIDNAFRFEEKELMIFQSMLGEHVGLEHLLDNDGGHLHHPGGL